VFSTENKNNLIGTIGTKLGGMTNKIDGLLPGVLALIKQLLGGSGGSLGGSTGANNFLTSLKNGGWLN